MATIIASLVSLALLLSLVVSIVWLIALGSWKPVWVALAASTGAMLVFGFVQMILAPALLAGRALLLRKRNLASALFLVPVSVVNHTMYFIYMSSCFLYFEDVDGPPRVLMIAVAVGVSIAPFSWAASKDTTDEGWDSLLMGFVVPAALICAILLWFGAPLIPWGLAALALFMVGALIAHIAYVYTVIRRHWVLESFLER